MPPAITAVRTRVRPNGSTIHAAGPEYGGRENHTRVGTFRDRTDLCHVGTGWRGLTPAEVACPAGA